MAASRWNQDLAIGSFVYLDFAVAEDPWHEFMIGPQVGPYSYVVSSPDDVFVQDVAVSADVSGVRVGKPGWVLPEGLGARHNQPVYRFTTKPTIAEVEAFVVEAEKMADDYSKGLVPGHPVVPHASGVDAEAPAAERPARRVQGKSKPAVDPNVVYALDKVNFKDGEWVLAFGDDSNLGAIYTEPAIRAFKAITGLRDWLLGVEGDVPIVLKHVPGGQGNVFIENVAIAYGKADKGHTPRDGVNDARILPIGRNKRRVRYLSFPEQVWKCQFEEFSEEDWMLQGPRSTPYCLGEVARINTGMVTRSVTWQHENHLAPESHNALVHEMISEAVELFLCVEQYDIVNSAGVESLMRELQYIEFEVKKKREAKAPPDQGYYFRGRSKLTGGAILCPALLKWISERASRDSSILKEQRKAAEEFALARKSAKGDKSGKGDGN